LNGRIENGARWRAVFILSMFSADSKLGDANPAADFDIYAKAKQAGGVLVE
jgi:hypothetical protein